MGLKKIKGRTIKTERIWVGDIEASNWVEKFELGGYYNGSDYFLFDKVGDMVEFALSKLKHNPIFYFHYFNYDSVFILEYIIEKGYIFDIVRTSGLIYQIRVKRRKEDKNWVYFRDSYALLRSSLNELGKMFLGEEKIEFDYEIDIKDRGKLEEYLKKDLWLLYNVLMKFFELIDYINAISVSSLSLTMFRRSIESEIYYKINKTLYEYGRQFYSGGRTEVFRFYGKNIKGYDVNSMYPYVMEKYEFPYGKAVFVYKRNYRRLGFYKVRLKFIYDDYITPLWIKKEKLFFPFNDTYENIYFLNSYELDLLEELGYHNYEVIEGVEFLNKGFIFKDFVDELYKKRISAKQSGNRALEYTIKLMLNSLYGKFGQTPERKKYLTTEQVVELFDRVRRIEDAEKRDEKLRKLKEQIYYFGHNLYLYKMETFFAEYMNVFLSAMITSLARLELFNLLYKYREHIYYCDTDSLFVDCEIDSSLVDKYELGKLKLEKEFDEVLFLLPKLYVYRKGNDEGSIAKGFKRKIKFEEALNFYHYGIPFWDEYLEPSSFLEAFRNLSYLYQRFSKTRAIKKVMRVIRARYDKRKVVGTNDTYPYGYSELVQIPIL
jgi:hypothetical protein